MDIHTTEEFERQPGLFRLWDLPQVVVAGRICRIEDVGVTVDGGPLFAVYFLAVNPAVRA